MSDKKSEKETHPKRVARGGGKSTGAPAAKSRVARPKRAAREKRDDDRQPAEIAAGARRPRTPPHPLAAVRSTSARTRPPARSSQEGRPRIRASHAEGADADLSDREIAQRRARAKASVRALGASRVAPQKLPPPSKREGAGPRSGPAKRRSQAPQSTASAASQELAIAIAAAGLDKKAVGVEVIDVSGRVDYADYIVIMTGTSDRHVHAIAMGIEEGLKKKKVVPLSVEGLGAATWVLMDFSDVVVHVFQEDTRRVYDIEGLWMDAGRLPVSTPTPT